MRSKGEGSLYKRASDDMWMAYVEIPTVDGSRRRKYVSSKNRNKAIEKLKKLRKEVDAGRVVASSNTKVADWLDRWLNEIRADHIRPTTRRDYANSIRLHINPAIGTKRLGALTPEDVRKMHRAIGARRAAEKTHVILQRALRDAVREGVLDRNVAELVYKPKYAKKPRSALSLDLAKRVLATAVASRDESQTARWVAAFLTGARQGELLGLEWDRVDLDRGVMDVSEQLQQLPQSHGCGEPDVNGIYPCGRLRVGYCPRRRWDVPPDFEIRVCHRSLVWTQPKTTSSARFVPILMPLATMLSRLRDDQGVNPHGLVWHHVDGRPISPREDSRAWHQLLRNAGVIGQDETLPLHTARHTTATLLRAAGVDEQTRMEILGHATVDAQRIYAHRELARNAAAMAPLTQLLR